MPYVSGSADALAQFGLEKLAAGQRQWARWLNAAKRTDPKAYAKAQMPPPNAEAVYDKTVEQYLESVMRQQTRQKGPKGRVALKRDGPALAAVDAGPRTTSGNEDMLATLRRLAEGKTTPQQMVDATAGDPVSGRNSRREGLRGDSIKAQEAFAPATPGNYVEQARPGAVNKWGVTKRVFATQKRLKEPAGVNRPTLNDYIELRASGRHNPNESLVPITPINRLTNEGKIDAKAVKAQPGYAPDRLYWRGGVPPQALAKNESIWGTAHPAVAAGYAHGKLGTPAGTVRVWDHTKVPAAKQGPWTPHIAKDPLDPMTFENWSQSLGESMLSNGRAAGRSPMGMHPEYEKVINGGALRKVQPLGEYKVLTPGLLMHTRGQNVLRQPPA